MTRIAAIEIRDFHPDDAEGVAALFREIYGARYVYPEVYLPSFIRARNASGAWHSAVACRAGQVVGHVALLVKPGVPQYAEIGLAVVRPAATGSQAGVRICRHLLDHARRAGMRMLTAMLVCSHVQSQRLAPPLDFGTTGLLLDYLPSPFGARRRESYVLCCRALAACPLPDIAWPAACRPWLDPILARHGVIDIRKMALPPLSPAFAMRMTHDEHLLAVTLDDIRDATLDEVAHLPAERARLVRLRAGPGLPEAMARLARIGLRHTGVMPAPEGGWYWLMQDGFRAEEVQLLCPQAQAIFDSVRSE